MLDVLIILCDHDDDIFFDFFIVTTPSSLEVRKGGRIGFCHSVCLGCGEEVPRKRGGFLVNQRWQGVVTRLETLESLFHEVLGEVDSEL